MNTGRVYIVRHGNTFDQGDVVLRVGGRTDLPLSSSGATQAKALAAHFQNIRFGAAYSSNLKRTRQTAEIILGAQTYRLAGFLKEVDYGQDDGKPETDVAARIGHAALKQWDLHAIPPPGWHVDVDDIRTSWQAFLAQCDPRRHTLVVTSNGIVRFLLDVVRGGDTAPRKLRTGAYGVVSFGKLGPDLEEWNIRPKSVA